MYTIKEFAKLTGLNASTLRYYEDLGLLKNVERDKNGLRLYSEDHLGRIGSIECFKGCGVPLSTIQRFCLYEENTPEHIDEILQLIQEEDEKLTEKIASMQKQQAHMRYKQRFFSRVKEDLASGNSTITWDEFGEIDDGWKEFS